MIRRLLHRCLTKDSKQRLRDIGEARIQIERTISGEVDESTRDAQSPTTMLGASRRLRLLPWAIAGFAIVAAGLTIAQYRATNPDEFRPVRRFILAPPAQGRLTSLLLSPDGTRLISTVRESGRWRLFERLLSAPNPRRIEGSEGAIDPFFSPDGKFVGFFANGLLKKVSLSGGAPETICNAQNDRGAVWGPDDNIVFAPGTDVPLHRVRASGGPVEAISTLDVSARERSHRWPDVLPDGKSILFTIAYEVGNPLDDASIAVLDLATGKHKMLIKSAAFGRYSPSGHIVYARHGGLVAVPFNVERLEVTGPPVTFPEIVLMSVTNGGAQFSLARNGDLAYVEGRSDDSTAVSPLVWVDRRGGEQALSDDRHRYSMPRLTSDGGTLLVEVSDSGSSVWAYDLKRGTLSRITFGGVSYNPVPAPDGKRVAYEAVRDGVAGVMLARLDGSGEERLTATKRLNIPTSWTPDGKTLAMTAGSDSGFLEIWLVTVDGDREPQVFLQGPFNVGGASFSPDGHWVAYVSDESGRNEVYVRRYPESGNRIQISADGGSEPVWARNGRELFFRNGDETLAVDVALEGDFTAGRPRLLFSRYNPQSESGVAYDLVPDYDVSTDGQRFVIPKREVSDNPTGGVVLNWFEELRRLAPTP